MEGGYWPIFHPGKSRRRGVNLFNFSSDRSKRAEVARSEPSLGLDVHHNLFLCPGMLRCSHVPLQLLKPPGTLKGLRPVHGEGCLIQHLPKDRDLLMAQGSEGKGKQIQAVYFAICPLLVFPASSRGTEVFIPAEVDLQSPLSAGAPSLGADYKSSRNAIAATRKREAAKRIRGCPSSFIPPGRLFPCKKGRSLHALARLGEKVWKGHGSLETGIS